MKENFSGRVQKAKIEAVKKRQHSRYFLWKLQPQNALWMKMTISGVFLSLLAK